MSSLDCTRRRLLGLLAGTGIATGIGLSGCAVLTEQAGRMLASRLPLPEAFRVPLPLPKVARPARRGADADAYELVQRPNRMEIIPGYQTEIWGFDGSFPGPTFDVRAGRPITVTITNELPVPTSTHLHGGVTPADSDGYPTHLIVPTSLATTFHPGHGTHTPADPSLWKLDIGSKVHSYPIDQAAATLWYHDHRMDFTAAQMWRGLAGFFLIRDGAEDALPLPAGDKELPLMICDRSFDADGALHYPALDPTLLTTPGVEHHYTQGVEGDVILVNGAPWPHHDVADTRYRLRILNASHARRYALRLDPPPEQAFNQIGSDNGLLPAPQRLDTITIAPGERVDVIVDFSGYPIGTQITLTNTLGTGPARNVMRFTVTRRETDHSTVPDKLVDVDTLSRTDAVARRRFDFRLGRDRKWLINGKNFDLSTTLASPALGATELWTLSSDFHHPVHVHLGHFQVLTRNGNTPAPIDAGWKDTVDLRPYEVVEVLIRFTGFRGRYVLHCHNLGHEDMAMMANLDVI